MTWLRVSLVPIICWMAILLQAQPEVHHLDGEWEGILTQKEGGVRPEYKIRLVLKISGQQAKGHVEVEQGDDVYIKTQISGTLYHGFYLALEDGLVLNQKDLVDMTYCVKTYQLYVTKKDGKHYLKGKWQGSTSGQPCIPGEIVLTRKTNRA